MIHATFNLKIDHNTLIESFLFSNQSDAFLKITICKTVYIFFQTLLCNGILESKIEENREIFAKKHKNTKLLVSGIFQQFLTKLIVNC